MATRPVYEERDAQRLEQSERVPDSGESGRARVNCNSRKGAEGVFFARLREYIQPGVELPAPEVEGILKWLGEVYRFTLRVAELEFRNHELYDLRPSREDAYRHFYRQFVEIRFAQSSRPAAVERWHIAMCVSRALVDWLFRDVRVRDRPYLGVQSRLDHWGSPKVDSKGREFAPRVPKGQKFSTRYGVPEKAPPPGDPGKSEVRCVADFEEHGRRYMYDALTGEILDVR